MMLLFQVDVLNTFNVYWNNPFKGRIIKFYDEWLASGLHYYTEAENMKTASHYLIVTWILEGWIQLAKKLIIRSFKPRALTLKNDSSEGNNIHCFESRQPCLQVTSSLKDQVNILNNDNIVNCNPFEATGWDEDEANTKTKIINESDNKDDFIDIE